jgi:hypothetical protein
MKRLTVVLLLAACSHAPPKKEEPAPQAAAAAPVAPRKDPDEDMQVTGTLGTLNDEEVSGPFQRRWDEITQCYQDAKSKLWYLGGKVELKIRIDKTGAPKSTFVSSSTVGSYDVERCILGIARELQFSRPHGGSEAEFTYPIEFRGKGAVTTWDEGRVTPHIKKPKNRKDVSECKKQSPNGMPAQLMMTMYVAPGGKITSAGLAADAPLDDAFAACLVGKTKLWRLDDPLGKIAKCTVGVQD